MTQHPNFAPSPPFPLNASILVSVLGALAVMAASIQLAIGADPAVLAIALASIGIGLFGFLILGSFNLCAWVLLLYALGNIVVALLVKTALGQPLGSHLSAPALSFLVVLACIGAMLVAALLAQRLPIGKPLFDATGDFRFLTYLSWACFGLGTAFWLLNRWLQGPDKGGFGGLALFRDLLVMAVIARTALLLLRGGYRWSLDVPLGLMMAAALFMGFLDNQKTAAALPVAGHFLTVLFFRRSLPWRSVALLAAGAIVFVTLLTPVVHAFRAMGQQQLDLRQRVEFVVQHLKQLAEDPRKLREFEELAAQRFALGYYDYFGGDGKGQMLLGRFVSVQQIDPVIAAVQRSHPQGGDAVWPAFSRLAPSFLMPGKPEFTEAYHTLVHYRLINPQGGKFPTLPLAGQTYAAYGWAGVSLISFLTFLGFFLAIRKLTGNLYKNIYAIFFLCSFVLVYVSQGDFGQYAGAVLRNFPMFAVIFWFIQLSHRLRISKQPFFTPPGKPGYPHNVVTPAST